jgi:probable HAF family extracellular repeat protein
MRLSLCRRLFGNRISDFRRARRHTPHLETIEGRLLLSGNPFTYTAIEVFGNTLATGINDSGQVVGYYLQATHSFLLSDGSYTTLNVPNAQLTEAEGINNSGQIVGWDDSNSFLLSDGS